MPTGEHLRIYDKPTPKKAVITFRLPSTHKTYFYKFLQKIKGIGTPLYWTKNTYLRTLIRKFNQRDPSTIEEFKQDLNLPNHNSPQKLDSFITFRTDSEDKAKFETLCLSRPISAYLRAMILYVDLTNFPYNLIL